MADDKKDTVEVDNRPTSQKDLEARLAVDHLPESARQDNTKNDVLNPEKVNAPYATKEHDTRSYRGVSAEYMQYANDTEKPLEATEGPEAEALKRLSAGTPSVRKSNPLDTTLRTEVGVAATETLNTAVSGGDYSSKLVDAKPDYAGGPPVVGLAEPTAVSPAAEQKPAESVETPAPKAAAKPAAAKRTSNS